MNLFKISLISNILIFIAISWGAYVRAFGAGLGCGDDWPLCNGELMPSNILDIFVFLEYIHRLIAIFASIFVILTLYISIKYYMKKTPILIWATITTILLIIQVLMGMIVVFMHLDPLLSALHLTFATATFGSSMVVMVLAYTETR